MPPKAIQIQRPDSFQVKYLGHVAAKHLLICIWDGPKGTYLICFGAAQRAYTLGNGLADCQI